jgi:uncharacterized protein
MIMNYFKSILIILSLFGVNVYAQTDSINKIRVLARAKQNEIILRWAPTNPLAWQMANKYGYTVERVTMTKKNKLIKDRSLKNLSDSPIKPYTEDQWEKIVKDEKGNIDKNAAVAVQAIFGKSFTVTDDNSKNITKVFKKAEENERRFTFALFAADQSLKVAKAMGLLYNDKDVAVGEKYLYRIYANVPKAIMTIDTGYVYTGLADNSELPRPLDFSADFGDQYVTLSWNREFFEKVFSNYIMERSDNGKDFYPLDELPFINTAPDNKPNPRLMYRMDSIADKNLTYYYRLRGRNIFEEFGPWSDTVSGQAVSVFKYKPAILTPEVIENKKVKIKWEFPAEYIGNIEYFSVYRSNKSDGQFMAIKENLGTDTRSYMDEKPMPVNYYMIKAYDKNKNSGASFPALAQLVDSIPPAKPELPKASVDTLGNVTLTWKKGKDEDIFGYRIFRSNFKNSEFGQITSEPVKGTAYNDKIRLDNLSKEIYYKIAVIDYNFNQSELSDAVLLIKPDRVPPVPPLIKSVKSTSKGVILEWINSPSKDVVKYELSRKEKDKDNWEIASIFNIKDNKNATIDSLIQSDILYEYKLLAVDSAGNKSTNAKTVFGKKISSGIRPSIVKIKTEKDTNKKQIILLWIYVQKDIDHFIIYRGTGENPISYYKMVKKDLNQFIDNELQINTSYKYKIKAIFSDGSESEFSKEILVRF